MLPSPSPVVGRLAPSPTGGLHVGHARTFLIAWLAARSRGGRIVLRIEDIDASRVRPEALSGLIVDLRWVGLDWDEGPDLGGAHGPYLQSQRTSLYEQMLDRLKQKELVYPCTCTRAEIARVASAPHSGEEGPSYPGTCLNRRAEDADSLSERPFSWRFRVPKGRVEWNDQARGWQSVDPSAVGGDFLVGRSTGEPAYQLAVVCDDHFMEVNQVIRGDDLVTSTPRQILLYEAMGWTPPSFGHVPLVIDDQRKRLAKRDQSIKLETLRERGVDPRRLIKVLANSIGMSKGPGDSWPEDWIERFDLASVPRGPWVAPGVESLTG